MNRTISAAPKARKVFTSEIVAARKSSALVVGFSVRAPLVKATVVQTIPAMYLTGRSASKRIALTPMEVSALRLAARMAGLI